MTDMSEDRRPGKLHKQIEVEDDDTGDDGSTGKSSTASVTVAKVSGEIQKAVVYSGNMSSALSSSDKPHPQKTMPPPMVRKQTLTRTHALERNSPPPESFFSQISQTGEVQNGHLLTNGGAVPLVDKNGKLTGQSHEAKEFLLTSYKTSNDSGHGTLDHNDDASDTSVLSRDSSLENAAVRDVYRDSSGVNIPKFMKDTLLKSAKDRKAVLSYEEQLLNFINNDSAQVYKMAEMTSYDRMIVHRLAAFLGLEHNVDSTGKCVILNRTENTRSVKLSELIQLEGAEHEPKKKILLKKPSSFDVPSRGSNKAHFGSHRAKSLEERQQNYIEARERIFRTDENQGDGTATSQNVLISNTMSHLPQQQSLDSTRSNGQHSTKWISTESSGYESLKNSPNTQHSTSSSIQSSCPLPLSIAASTEQPHNYKSTLDAAPSTVTQVQPPASADSSLYHFDPTCPPPFIVQSTAHPPALTPPASHVVYPGDNITDVSTKFATTAVRSIDQGCEPFVVGASGQPIPLIMPHPQPVYQPQFTQGQYLITPSPVAGQQHVRFIAIPYPQGHGQQLLQGAVVDSQGQTTVPMPAVGVPAVLGVGGYQVTGSPYQPSVAVGNTAHCVDLNSVTYHYGAVPEAVVVGGAGGLNTSGAVSAQGASHLVLAYNQPQAQPQQQQQQQQTVIASHQPQFAPAGSTPQGTFYTIPVSSPTPPLSLAQPPPSSYLHQQQPSQQQQHQPTVFYAPSIGNTSMYSVPVSNPSSSLSSFKPISTQFIPAQYHHLSAPAQPQPLVLSPSNGHHPPQLTLNYGQSVPFNPAQPIGQVATLQGSQLVAVQTSPYHIRPVGTTVLQLAGSPVVQTPQLGTGPQLQSYQLLRPTGSVPDLRMINPVPVRPRLSPLQNTAGATAADQSRSKYSNQSRQTRKGGRKLSRDADDYHNPHTAAATQPQTAHTNIIIPLSLSSSISQPHPHLSSSSSNRQ